MSQNDSIPENPTWGILLISILSLYLEMLLIRWIGTEVRIFAYLQNTVLLVCFLGLGLSCFTCRRPIELHKSIIKLFLLVLLFALPWTRALLGAISESLSVLSDFLIWSNSIANSPKQTVLLVTGGLCGAFVLMAIIVDIFIPIGRILGRLMDDHPDTIWAYSVNVAGSLIGVWLFVLLSHFHQPPVVWFLLLVGLYIFFIGLSNRHYRLNLALLLSMVILAWFAGKQPGAIEVVWSPYQKLALHETKPDKGGLGNYAIEVNNTDYQEMLDLKSVPKDSGGFSQYGIPYLLYPNPQSCLIVGAGSGNDAAGALRHNVPSITAVEIDPAIITMGRRYHPENSYSAHNVEVVTDDARSYFALCDKKFDVISFGLLDSHTTTAMTNARLDHYVYARESIAKAKTLLAPNGILVMSFMVKRLYIADRLAGVLKEVFGQEPLVFQVPYSNLGRGGMMFVAGDMGTVRSQLRQNKELAAFIGQCQMASPVPLSYTAKIATDDWPYLYLAGPAIPVLFYLLAGLLVLLLVRCNRHDCNFNQVVRSWRLSHWHFFFLGAGFLLLEVQNISKASVVLGNTWEVNAVIVSGVLAMVLLANMLAFAFPRLPLGFMYAGLIGSCAALYCLDLSRFAFLPYIAKALLVGSLTTLPMLFSGVIFIRSFAATTRKDEALGSNLLGALTGALLQSVTFVTGIKALLLIVAGFYFLALLTSPVIVMAGVYYWRGVAARENLGFPS